MEASKGVSHEDWGGTFFWLNLESLQLVPTTAACPFFVSMIKGFFFFFFFFFLSCFFDYSWQMLLVKDSLRLSGPHFWSSSHYGWHRILVRSPVLWTSASIYSYKLLLKPWNLGGKKNCPFDNFSLFFFTLRLSSKFYSSFN